MKKPALFLASMAVAVLPALAGQPVSFDFAAGSCAESANPAAKLPSVVIAPGSCSATCGDMGGLATVQCNGTCTIVDQNCNAGVRGYVQCQGGARADCDPCQWCSVEGPCPEGGWISCGTWGYQGQDCQGGNGACFVVCDGQWDFCPGHEFEIWCGF